MMPIATLGPHPLFAVRAVAVAAVALLSACATGPAAPPAAVGPVVVAVAAAGGASAPTAAATRLGNLPTPPAAPAPKAFAEVIKDAKRDEGFIPVWRKDEKVWLEIAPERLNKPLLFSVNIASSVGERGLYASQMGPSWLAEFRKIGNHIQLVARQVDFRGDHNAALALAVREGFSDSLLAAAPVGSAEHPERKSVLIDASFLLSDIAGYSTALESAYRMPFAPDRSNSYFETVRSEPGLATLSAKVHYAVPRISAPPLLPPGATPPPRPSPPTTTPDPRSLFIGYVYNLRELPAEPMHARAADPRVGYFTDSYTDLSDDLRFNPRVHHVKRWRLVKKDPAVALSEPVQPITYWLDKNIPERYRQSVTAGVLEWNKAFDRIGFKNAVVVKQQAAGDDFDTLDAHHASIRWFVGADVGFAIGPSKSDPRTGEILDADIGMSDVFGRSARRQVRDDIGQEAAPVAAAWQQTQARMWPGASGAKDADCSYAADGEAELGFALDLMAARGELDPESPAGEAFVQAYIKDVITHEVGHTLGLRHNFKASTTVSSAQLKDKAYGDQHGISASVMDYNAFNLPLNGEAPAEYNMTTLGAYDYWAIAYGYTQIDAVAEPATLAALAARSATDPQLAFGDDGDAGGFAGNEGLDPLANRFDLSDDPLAYYQRRMQMSKELWVRLQAPNAQNATDPERQRRSLQAGFRQAQRLPDLAAKYVGGMYTARMQPGVAATAVDRPAYRPVEPAQQRAALRFLTDEVFGSESFRFKPEFLTTLAPDYTENRREGPWSVQKAVLGLQTQALDRLMSPGTAHRLLELPNYLPEAQRRGAFSLSEVYLGLQDAVWSELKTGSEIDPLRRNLQREHLKRLQAILIRPNPALPADALSLVRLHATALQGELRRAASRRNLTVESRAHLQDSLGQLTEALRATLLRS